MAVVGSIGRVDGCHHLKPESLEAGARVALAELSGSALGEGRLRVIIAIAVRLYAHDGVF